MRDVHVILRQQAARSSAAAHGALDARALVEQFVDLTDITKRMHEFNNGSTCAVCTSSNPYASFNGSGIQHCKHTA